MRKLPAGGMRVTEDHIRQARLYQANYRTVWGHMIPSMIGLALAIGVKRASLMALKIVTETPGCTPEQNALKEQLRDILDEIHDAQHHELINGGLSGTMNSNIVKLALGKHGYSEKVDSTIGNPDGTPLDTKWTVEIVDATPRA